MLYLRMCLAYSAGAAPTSTSLADMQDDAPAIGRYIHTLLSSVQQPTGSKSAEANPVHVYMDLLQQLLSAVGGNSCLWCLNEQKMFCMTPHRDSSSSSSDWNSISYTGRLLCQTLVLFASWTPF